MLASSQWTIQDIAHALNNKAIEHENATIEQYFTRAQAAKSLNLSVRTISRYIEEGKIKAAKTNRHIKNSAVRIAKSEIERFVASL